MAGKYCCPPEHQKKGLGTALIEAVEAVIRPRADHYQLYTNIVMQSKARWYLSLGFKQTKEAVEDGFHRLYFKKTLSQYIDKYNKSLKKQIDLSDSFIV